MKKLALTTAAFLLAAGASAQTRITIASVNNPDMVTMQELSSEFETQNPDIRLDWLFLDEGTLRSRLTTDVATGSGAFDVVTVGAYEVPLWAANDWILSVDALADQYPDAVGDYDFGDLLPSVTNMLSYEEQLYALPFYGESSFTMYNERLFEEAGLTMPEQPTWEQIREFACELHDPANGVYGIVLRGKPGWGDNMAPITTRGCGSLGLRGLRVGATTWRPSPRSSTPTAGDGSTPKVSRRSIRRRGTKRSPSTAIWSTSAARPA